MYLKLMANVKDDRGRIEDGYPLLCMDCENDVFEWIDSREGESHGLVVAWGMYRCCHCGYFVVLDEGTFVGVEVDACEGWIGSTRHPGHGRTERKDPLIKSAEERWHSHPGGA